MQNHLFLFLPYREFPRAEAVTLDFSVHSIRGGSQAKCVAKGPIHLLQCSGFFTTYCPVSICWHAMNRILRTEGFCTLNRLILLNHVRKKVIFLHQDCKMWQKWVGRSMVWQESRKWLHQYQNLHQDSVISEYPDLLSWFMVTSVGMSH